MDIAEFPRGYRFSRRHWPGGQSTEGRSRTLARLSATKEHPTSVEAATSLLFGV